MYGNVDDAGTSFSGRAVAAASPDVARLGSYAALDPVSGHLRVMLIGKQTRGDQPVHVDLGGLRPGRTASRYTYAGAPDGIEHSTVEVAAGGFDLVVPASSITLVDLSPG